MKKEKITPVINIEKDIDISKYQTAVFWKGTELGDLYEAMVKRWKLYGSNYTGPFGASLFYNLETIQILGHEGEAANTKQAIGGTFNGCLDLLLGRAACF